MSNDLLYKICLGQATSEEEEEWRKGVNLPADEDVKQLQDSCAYGFNVASQLDISITLNKILEELKKLNEKIDKL